MKNCYITFMSLLVVCSFNLYAQQNGADVLIINIDEVSFEEQLIVKNTIESYYGLSTKMSQLSGPFAGHEMLTDTLLWLNRY